ncbi:MAG: hypothetical protein GY842_27450 [bacterium]|nr:hypothetical protein [bacterium]
MSTREASFPESSPPVSPAPESAAQRRHDERLAHLESLAPALAHDLNNALGTMRLAVENSAALAAEPATGVLLQCLEDVTRAADRAEAVLEAIRSYAATDLARTIPIEVNQGVSAAALLVGKEVHRRGGKLELQLAAHLPLVDGWTTGLTQVLVGLIQDILERGEAGGRFNVRTAREADSVGILLRAEFGARPGGLPEPLDHAASGPGLPSAVEIIAAYGGTLEVEGSVESAITVTIRLPVPK